MLEMVGFFLFLLLLHASFLGFVASSAAGTETLIGIIGEDFILLGADRIMSQSIALQSSSMDKISLLSEPFPFPFWHDQQEQTLDKIDLDWNTEALMLAQQTIAVAAAGDAADTDRLVALLKANAALLEYEAGLGCDVQVIDCAVLDSKPVKKVLPSPAGLSVHAAARLARSQIASRLRSAAPLRVCLLVAGMMPTFSANHNGNDKSHLESDLQLQRPVDQPASTDVHFDNSLSTPSQTSFDSFKSGLQLQPRLYWLDEYGSMQRLLYYGAHGFGSNFCLSILDQGYHSHMTRPQAIALMNKCFEQLRTRYVINTQPRPPCIKCIDRYGCSSIDLT